MPSMRIDLYDDAKTVIVAGITVICTESEARYLEKLAARKRFPAHLLAPGFGRNMTFRQFRQHFLDEAQDTGGRDFWERTEL